MLAMALAALSNASWLRSPSPGAAASLCTLDTLDIRKDLKKQALRQAADITERCLPADLH